MKYSIAELRELYPRQIYPVEAEMLDHIEAQDRLLAEAREAAKFIEKYADVGRDQVKTPSGLACQAIYETITELRQKTDARGLANITY